MNSKKIHHSGQIQLWTDRENQTTVDNIMNRVSLKINQLTYSELITYANGLHRLFGNGKERDKQTKSDYINLVIMPLVGLKVLPTICINQSSGIIDQFRQLIDKQVELSMKNRLPGPK